MDKVDDGRGRERQHERYLLHQTGKTLAEGLQMSHVQFERCVGFVVLLMVAGGLGASLPLCACD